MKVVLSVVICKERAYLDDRTTLFKTTYWDAIPPTELGYLLV